MPKPMTLNVRVSGALGDFVAANVGESGVYENVSEYVRDLIRRDKERTETESFHRLKAELTRAFAAPDSAYRPLDAETVIRRGRRSEASVGSGSRTEPNSSSTRSTATHTRPGVKPRRTAISGVFSPASPP